MPQIPSGAVTFLFTDIEGSTRLLKELRDEYPEALEEHQRRLRSAFDEAGGPGNRHARRRVLRRLPQGARRRCRGLGRPAVARRTQMAARLPAARAHGDSYRRSLGQRRALPRRRRSSCSSNLCRRTRWTGTGVARRRRTSSKTRRSSSLTSTFVIWGSSVSRISTGRSASISSSHPAWPKNFLRSGRRIRRSPDVRGSWQEAAEDVPKSRLGKRRVLAAAAVGAIAIVGVVVGVLTASGSSRPSLVPPNSLAAIDPQSGKVVSHVAIGSQLRTGAGTLPVGRSIAVGSGAVWVVNPNDATISRVDPQTGRVSPIGGIGGTVTDIAAAPDGVWATLRSAGLAHIDPSSNSAETVEPSVRGSFRPSFDGIAVRSRALFLGRSDLHGLSLDRFDTRNQRLGGSVHVGQDADHAIATGLGAVWISDRADNSVTEVSPGRMSVIGRASVAGPGALAVGAGKVWVTDQIDNQLWYLVPAALNVPSAAGRSR